MVRFSLCCVSPQPGQAFPPLEPRCQPSPGGLAAPSLSRGFFAFGCVFWLLFLISVLLYAATGCGVKNTDVQKKPASGSLAPAFFSVSRQISVHVSLSLWLRGGRGEAVWSVEPAGPMSLHSWKNRETPLLLPASCLTLVLGTLQSGPAIPKHRCRGSPVWSQHPPARLWGSWSLAGFTHPCGSRGSSVQEKERKLWFKPSQLTGLLQLKFSLSVWFGAHGPRISCLAAVSLSESLHRAVSPFSIRSVTRLPGSTCMARENGTH